MCSGVYYMPTVFSCTFLQVVVMGSFFILFLVLLYGDVYVVLSISILQTVVLHNRSNSSLTWNICNVRLFDPFGVGGNPYMGSFCSYIQVCF